MDVLAPLPTLRSGAQCPDAPDIRTFRGYLAMLHNGMLFATSHRQHAHSARAAYWNWV